MNGNEIKANEAARKKRERMNAELNWKFDEVDEWWIAVWLIESRMDLLNYLFLAIPFQFHQSGLSFLKPGLIEITEIGINKLKLSRQHST